MAIVSGDAMSQILVGWIAMVILLLLVIGKSTAVPYIELAVLALGTGKSMLFSHSRLFL